LLLPKQEQLNCSISQKGVGMEAKRQSPRNLFITFLLLFTFVYVLVLPTQTANAATSIVQISSDLFTNSTSQHQTQVEPDSFSFGSTIVSVFQVGRIFNGGSSDIGWATSTDGGTTWTYGF